MSAKPPTKVCVVIPTYNEKENLGTLLDGIRASRLEGEQVLFVDDSSPDGTAELIKEAASREDWIHLLSRSSKKGIGSAYLDGFKEALSTLQPDVIVEMDADLQHPPAVIPSLVKATEAGADVAVASRYVKGGGSRGWGFARRLVSKGANWQTRTFLGLGVKDCTSGFRAYKKRAVQKLLSAKVPTSGFEFQVIALHALKDGMKMVEVPFIFEVRKAGESKLGIKDIVRFFFYVTWVALG
jgi:dolichol-phosphate mannosyltransferase